MNLKDMFLEQAYMYIKDVEDDIVISLTEEQENNIKTLINLGNYNTETELRILRNYLVMMISSLNKDNYDNYGKNRILITVITGMIDKKLFSLGVEV